MMILLGVVLCCVRFDKEGWGSFWTVRLSVKPLSSCLP